MTSTINHDTAVPKGPLLRPSAAAVYLGVSMSSFYYLIEKGYLPRPIKMGSRIAGMPKDQLDKIIAMRAANGSASPGDW